MLPHKQIHLLLLVTSASSSVSSISYEKNVIDKSIFSIFYTFGFVHTRATWYTRREGVKSQNRKFFCFLFVTHVTHPMLFLPRQFTSLSHRCPSRKVNYLLIRIPFCPRMCHFRKRSTSAFVATHTHTFCFSNLQFFFFLFSFFSLICTSNYIGTDEFSLSLSLSLSL